MEPGIRHVQCQTRTEDICPGHSGFLNGGVCCCVTSVVRRTDSVRWPLSARSDSVSDSGGRPLSTPGSAYELPAPLPAPVPAWPGLPSSPSRGPQGRSSMGVSVFRLQLTVRNTQVQSLVVPMAIAQQQLVKAPSPTSSRPVTAPCPRVTCPVLSSQLPSAPSAKKDFGSCSQGRTRSPIEPDVDLGRLRPGVSQGCACRAAGTRVITAAAPGGVGFPLRRRPRGKSQAASSFRAKDAA